MIESKLLLYELLKEKKIKLDTENKTDQAFKRYNYTIDDKLLLMTCYTGNGNKCYDSRISLKIIKTVIRTLEKDVEKDSETDVLRKSNNYYPPNKPKRKIQVREDEISLKEVF